MLLLHELYVVMVGKSRSTVIFFLKIKPPLLHHSEELLLSFCVISYQSLCAYFSQKKVELNCM